MRRYTLLLTVALGGCAVLASRPPPPREDWATAPPRLCSGAPVGSTLDVIGASLALAGVLALGTRDCEGDCDWKPQLLLAAIGGLQGASLVYGVSVHTDCRDYDAFLEARFPTPAAEACARDVDCPGDRLCVDRQCVAPPAP